MNPSFISLLSIFVGIVGAHFFGRIFRKYHLGFTGNTIAGVFGSILLIKSIGRLGFDPSSIILADSYLLLFVNLTVSFLGGLAVIPGYLLKTKAKK